VFHFSLDDSCQVHSVELGQCTRWSVCVVVCSCLVCLLWFSFGVVGFLVHARFFRVSVLCLVLLGFGVIYPFLFGVSFRGRARVPYPFFGGCWLSGVGLCRVLSVFFSALFGVLVFVLLGRL